MSRAERKRAVLEQKKTMVAFKKLFHGAKPAHFITFGSGPGANSPVQNHFGKLSTALIDKLADANADGASICMLINTSDGEGRKKESIIGITALFIDKDGGDFTIKQAKALRPEPHLIVKTSPGKFHAYWLVSDVPVDRFPAYQRALAKRFGTDSAVSDVARVMRVPGTFNNKYPDAPQAKVVHEAEDMTPLAAQQLVEGLGIELEPREHETQTPATVAALLERHQPSDAAGSDFKREEIEDALASIPADEREVWFKMGAALHAWNPTSAGYEIWEAWSRKSSKYAEADQRKTWAGFKAEAGTTLATLFQLARQHGWAPVALMDEATLAERFCSLYQDKLRFDPAAMKWFSFDGTAWLEDPHSPAVHARKMIMALSAVDAGNNAHKHFRSAAGFKSIVTHAQFLPQMAITSSEFDRAEHLLALKEGVVDLQTGTWRKAQPDDFLGRRAQTSFVIDAQCPVWTGFFRGITQGDKEYAQYLQRALGYTLFGHTKEQVFFLMIGTGGNGKGVFTRVIKALMGPYAQILSPNVLTAAYTGNPNSPSPAIAQLKGARMVICSELKQRTQFDEAFIKQFTGGDELSARRNYGEMETFKPQGALWMSTNSMPEIEAGDHAMWRRLVPLPFEAKFTGPDADVDLETKLMAELPGILQMLLRGAQAYATNGLGTCKAVQDYYRKLKDGADSMAAWIKHSCRQKEDASTSASQAYSHYERFTRQAKRKPLSNVEFKQRLKKLGFDSKRRNSGIVYLGLLLLDAQA